MRIFAGAERSRYGNIIPTGIGRLCNWTPDPDGPPADEYTSFGAYQRSLSLKCDEGEPGVINWRPDENTPDTVYYQCFTHRYLGWKINVLDSCEQGAASEVREVFAEPETSDDDIMEAEASIQHESKVRPDELFLLKHEVAKVDAPRKHNFESHKNLEISKIIADGIRAAEALEESIKLNGTDSDPTTTTESNDISANTVYETIEPLPTFLTPPRGQTVRPFRYDVRPSINKQQMHQTFSNKAPPPPPPVLISHYKNSGPQVIRLIYKDTKPIHPFILREHNENPIRKTFTEQRSPIKLPLPPPPPSVPLRRDFVSKINNHPVPSHQNHAPVVPLRKGANYRGQYNGPKNKFQAPYSIKKNIGSEQTSTTNDGFRPSSVIIESGFLPITKSNHHIEKNESKETNEDQYEEYDYEQPVEQQAGRRSDQAIDSSDVVFPNNESDGEIKSFEPMFIPSPLDSTSQNQRQISEKKQNDDLNDMEMEDGEDKLAMAGERHDSYYLPPVNHQKTTKLFPEGAVVAYDGKAVLDMPGLAPPLPSRSTNLRARISSSEQLLSTPQFGPFRGEFPPLTFKGSKGLST